MTISRLYNAIINRCYTLFAKLYLYSVKASFGKGLFVMNSFPRFLLCKGSCIQIGENFTINGNSVYTSTNNKSSIAVMKNACLKIGNHVGINGATIFCSNRIVLGDYVIVGEVVREL